MYIISINLQLTYNLYIYIIVVYKKNALFLVIIMITIIFLNFSAVCIIILFSRFTLSLFIVNDGK